MTWVRLPWWVLAAAGDDGTGVFWKRLTPEGREVVRRAFVAARELGHPCMADEHLLLAVLEHRTSEAAAWLREQGLDPDAVRVELLRVGPTMGPRHNPADALLSLGIEVDEIRRRLEATYGADALLAAERRVRRRPRWRGGHPRPNPLCVYVLAKRSFEFAAGLADRRGQPVGPIHLLYGVLRDARDPLGTQLSRRSRRELATIGWVPGRPNPVRLVLERRGVDVGRLAAELGA